MKSSIKQPLMGSLVLRHPTFILIGMMRSGSNLLERRLSSLADVRCHGELFNPNFIGFSHAMSGGCAGYLRADTDMRNQNEVRFLKKLNAACDRPIMGLRLFLDHGDAITARLLYNPQIKKVVLSRNLLESYVSLQAAMETGVWLTTREHPPKPKPMPVSIEKLTTFALRNTLYYNDILTLLHRTNQPYVQLDYTELNSLERLNEIAAFIGSKERFETLDEPIKKQGPRVIGERVEKYPELQKRIRERDLHRWLAPEE